MQKQTIESIIRRYNLAGRCNQVRWTVDENKNLSIKYKDPAGAVLVMLDVQDFPLTECELGVYDTEALSKILSALDSEFKMDLGYVKNKPVSIRFEDSAIDVDFMLADLSVLPVVDGQKKVPDTHVRFDLDRESMERFIKAKNALKTSENFVITTDGNKIELVLNYSKTSTDRIKMGWEGDVTMQITEPLAFRADIFKDIFSCNKDFTTAYVEFSKVHNGLATIVFTGENFTAKYLVPGIELM